MARCSVTMWEVSAGRMDGGHGQDSGTKRAEQADVCLHHKKTEQQDAPGHDSCAA